MTCPNSKHFKKEAKSELHGRSNWIKMRLQYLHYKSVNCSMRQNKQCAFRGRTKVFSSNQKIDKTGMFYSNSILNIHSPLVCFFSMYDLHVILLHLTLF